MSVQEYLHRAKMRKAKRAEKSLVLFGPPKARAARLPSERKMLVKKLDSVFSMFVRLRDKKLYGLCRVCMIRPIEVCYHFIPRGRYSVRWDPENSCGACAPCNRGEQMNRLLYRDKHIAILGALKYSELEEKGRIRLLVSNDFLRERIETFKRLIGGERL